MPELLWLSTETPDIDGGGGQRRQHHQIRVLVERGIDVGVATTAGTQSHESLGEIAPVQRFEWRGRRRHRALDRVLRDAAPSRVVIAHVESARELAPGVARAGVPFLVDFHNVVSRWHASIGDESEASRWRDEELRVLRSAARATACSDEERAVLAALDPEIPIDVAPHGVDPAEWPAAALRERRDPAVALIGSWSHLPNRAGAEWLATTVWPTIRASVPDARLLLVGPGDPPPVACAAEGAETLGRVAALAELLGRVRVAVVPITHGIGTRVKFIESLASGAAVVATTAGFEGFVADGAFAHADEPEAFARACIELLQDEGAAIELGRRGRALAFSRYTWQQTAEPILAFAQGR